MTQEPGALSSSVIPILAVVAEDAVHDWGVAADRGDDDVAVDGLGDVGGFTAHGVAEVLDLDTFAAHNGDGGVAVFVGAPVADVSPLGHLAQSPVEVPEVYIESSSRQKTRLVAASSPWPLFYCGLASLCEPLEL